jgi:inosine-uridine nucleoside N-ribohydrolase
MKRVIIDTDPGIDDAAAILLALASPELSVEAITTVYGNGPVEASTRNARRILHAAGRTDIPVHQGAGKPLLRHPNPGWASQVHGTDALGDAEILDPPIESGPVKERHAVLEVIERVIAAPGEITLLSLGRLTNLALALALEPRVAQSVSEIIVMGGAIAVPGNISPVASANLYEDPEAAAMVYSSGAPLVQVGLDVCDLVEISQGQLDQISKAGTPITRLLTAATPCLQAYYRRRGMLADPNAVRYNDLPAIAYTVDPELFDTQDLYVAIETHSPLTRGQTVADRRNNSGHPSNVKVCTGLDAARLAALFTERITAYQAND